MALEKLNDDLNIVQGLVIPGLDDDLDVIQALDDEPNDVGGLSAAQLKAKFDEAGNRIKGYLNGKLLPAISDTVVEAEIRAEAEEERQTAEEARKAAERERVAAEEARKAAEEARAAAENGRVAAEQERVEAEKARKAAERARADEHTGIVAQAREQVALAETAREGAEAAELGADRSCSAAEKYSMEAQIAAIQSETAARVVGIPTAEKGAPGGVATLDSGGMVPEVQLRWRRRVIAVRERDPGKPDYGLGGGGADGGAVSVALDVGPYTGTAEVSAVVSGVVYDAHNLSFDGESAPGGTLIIKQEAKENG